MYIRNNMNLVYITAYTKFHQNSSICSEDLEEKHIFVDGRTLKQFGGYNTLPLLIPHHFLCGGV